MDVDRLRRVRHRAEEVYRDVSHDLVHAGAEDLDPCDRAVQTIVVPLGAPHVHLQVADHHL